MTWDGFQTKALHSHFHNKQKLVHLQTAFLWLESLLGIIFTPLDFNSIAFFTARKSQNRGYAFNYTHKPSLSYTTHTFLCETERTQYEESMEVGRREEQQGWRREVFHSVVPSVSVLQKIKRLQLETFLVSLSLSLSNVNDVAGNC